MRYLHEYAVDDTVELGETSLAQQEIDAFSERYDPQPQFLDDSIAGPLHGGRIASPWQAGALAQSIFVRNCLNQTADFGVNEIRSVRYVAPLRADSTVRGELHIKAIDEMPDQHDRGMIEADVNLYDDKDVLILSQNVLFAVAKKPRY